MDMFCSKCGNEIVEGSIFCSNCGTKINQTSEKRKKIKIVALGICTLLMIMVLLITTRIFANKTKLQYNTKYVYENTYITFFEDGTYERQVEQIIKANYTFDKKTKEIVCKEIQLVDGIQMDCEIYFQYLNANEIKETSIKMLGIVPNGVEFGQIFSTENILQNEQEDKVDKDHSNDIVEESVFDDFVSYIEHCEDTARADLLDNFRFYCERGFYDFTNQEIQELVTYSNTQLKEKWDKIAKIVETQEKYDTQYREQLSEIFKKTIHVEVNSEVQPKARVEYVAIDEHGIRAIYYSVEEENTTKKYDKVTNISDLDGMIKIDNDNTQTTQEEINQGTTERPTHTWHLSGLPYDFYYNEEYVLYYLPDDNVEWLLEDE